MNYYSILVYFQFLMPKKKEKTQWYTIDLYGIFTIDETMLKKLFDKFLFKCKSHQIVTVERSINKSTIKNIES